MIREQLGCLTQRASDPEDQVPAKGQGCDDYRNGRAYFIHGKSLEKSGMHVTSFNVGGLEAILDEYMLEI